MSEGSSSSTVEVLSQPNIAVIPFAVALPTSLLQGLDEPTPKGSPLALMGENGIVGTVILLNKSVQVWVGWGKLILEGFNQVEPPLVDMSTTRVGTGAPIMGPLLVAMPRTNYKGAFGGGGDVPCSQLIGTADSDDQMLATQMASRLSMRSGKAVFVSCQLSSGGDDWTAGLDREQISHRAAALAEREVWRILREHDETIQDAC